MSEEKKPISWVKSPSGVHEYYANMVHLMWSLDDVRLRIGQLVDSPETPNPGSKFIPIAQERAAITVSWRNAKLLRNELIRLIEAYEKANGGIETDINLANPSEDNL